MLMFSVLKNAVLAQKAFEIAFYSPWASSQNLADGGGEAAWPGLLVTRNHK